MHDMDYEVLTVGNIAEINVKDLEERLMEGGGHGTLAQYCHDCQWKDVGKVGEEGHSTLSADSSLMDTPSPSGSSDPPTPPSIIESTSTMRSPLDAEAEGFRLAQQSLAARYKKAQLPHPQMCLQEVEVYNVRRLVVVAAGVAL
ncbi:hypothetical protein RvY_18858 [Ramazzottius varieornatus]|uniref:Uncharacterized protein n=1 Tax=Ramazzottius varieornatus TaxID=947166 RepID=A0A1D1WBU8_RAMVA|nr:hypothetical protein RvY_18858 [Ramazzottius varieornatus]